MLLLEMVREKKQREMKQIKVRCEITINNFCIYPFNINTRTKRSDRWLWSKKEKRNWKILLSTDYKDIFECNDKPHYSIKSKILMY